VLSFSLMYGAFIRGEHPPKGGNKQLKRAFFRSAFAALSDPLSRAYYDSKRAEGKKRNAAASTSCAPCSAPAPPSSTNRQKSLPYLLDKPIGQHRKWRRSPGSAVPVVG
jgi:hypothetical protein